MTAAAAVDLRHAGPSATGPFSRPDPLEDGGDALPAADAHRDERVPAPLPRRMPARLCSVSGAGSTAVRKEGLDLIRTGCALRSSAPGSRAAKLRAFMRIASFGLCRPLCISPSWPTADGGFPARILLSVTNLTYRNKVLTVLLLRVRYSPRGVLSA